MRAPTFRIRMISACRRTEMQVGHYHFSTSYSPEEADALLCEWAPDEELFSFDGPRAWYCCEATGNVNFERELWKKSMRSLDPSEFLWHANPDPESRVPHITLEDDIQVELSANPIERAVAIVSNAGGPPLRRHGIMALRTRLVTHPRVDLYGLDVAWRRFRRHALAFPGYPANYRGELAGYWTDPARFHLMARYKAAVCLENTLEPYYFTEKLVGAVQAGCIPIYHAHETVRDGILRGAAWVDPATFDFDVDRTIEYALAQDVEDYRRVNAAWLASDAVRSTTAAGVFARIGEILERRSRQRIPVGDAAPRRVGNAR
jgi:hypothetical protein